MKRALLWALLIGACAGHAVAQTPTSITQRTAGLSRTEGFIPFYWDGRPRSRFPLPPGPPL
jgi:hypothetical protein